MGTTNAYYNGTGAKMLGIFLSKWRQTMCI